MQLKMHPDWEKILRSQFKLPYFKYLEDFVSNQYLSEICYPAEKKIFAAFNYHSPDQVKVVILGQDPYHGERQANGLCFSVPFGEVVPPSLKNILKELKNDLGASLAKSGDLSNWAKQGVLLLNTTLTVQASKAGSHQGKGWELFTDYIIKQLSETQENLVFLLWGSFARKKKKLIDDKKHLVLNSGHPSPLSANRGYWFGNKHFSKCNDYLIEKGFNPINWDLQPPTRFT